MAAPAAQAAAPLRVGIRADASHGLGAGHVMRCLSLAQALGRGGAAVQFVCQDLPGQLADRITAEGHGCSLLPIGLDAAADAEASRRALQATLAAAGPLDWLVVDHYGLAAPWQQALRPLARRVLVIDDLADRAHACDALLDQNLGRSAADYDGLLPAGAVCWIGPAHALLRPEFAAARPASLARRAGLRRPRHWLVSMGGSDPQQATVQVLRWLGGAGLLAADGQVTVVLGPQAQTLQAVQALLPTLGCASRLRVDVRAPAQMAALLAEADVAIGAAGTSAWERCCLGLPSLLLLLADNQAPGLRALVAQGAALSIGTPQAIATPPAGALVGPALEALAQAAAAVTDGLGAERVAAAMRSVSTAGALVSLDAASAPHPAPGRGPAR